MKKVKHKCIERMSSGTADKLGLTRAVLCNGQSRLILNNGNKCYIKAIGGLEDPKFQLVYFERSRYARDMKFHL